MTLTLTCRHCGTALNADTEDELVALVQEHARTHGDKPEMTREHILARLQRGRRGHEPTTPH